MMWQPSVNAIWLRAASSCAAATGRTCHMRNRASRTPARPASSHSRAPTLPPIEVRRRPRARAPPSGMTEPESRRLLVVANRTKSTPRLLEGVEDRARAGCEISLMVPPERHPDDPDWTPDVALELVQRAAGGQPVTLVEHGEDAAATI